MQHPQSAGPALPIPLTSFVGRDGEIAQVEDLLARNRLVTLTGVGGSGKTRLALEIAARLRERFADGVRFVDLTPLRDDALVPQMIALSLDVQEAGDGPLLERLARVLRDKQLLLVLDNFERLLPAAAPLVTLLQACPSLTALVTSRAALRVRGEVEVAVPPLPVPATEPRDDEAGSLLRFPSVTLFIERARAVRLGFDPRDADLRDVAWTCARLDGLPLAIELAAARARVLPPAEIRARLARRLTLLTGGARDLPERQQRMSDTIAWSYDLLGEDDRRLYRRLAVFAGGCTVAAADEVCNPDGELGDTLDRLTSLVDKSLVHENLRAYEPRFAMFETVREFATEQLEASGEAVALRQRHAAFFLALAERAEPKLRSGERAVWVEQLSAESDNLRAALQSLREVGDTRRELRLAGALAWFWQVNGRVIEGRSRLEDALAQPSVEEHVVERATALYGAGLLAWSQDDFAAAITYETESIALWQALGDGRNQAYALVVLGLSMRDTGDLARGRAVLEESLALFERTEDRWGMALASVSLGRAAGLGGDTARARALGTESAAMWRALDDHYGLGLSLSNLALVATQRGDLDEAASLYVDGLALFTETGEKRFIVRCVEGLAAVATARGEDGRAVRLLGAADRLRDDIGAILSHGERDERERAVAAARRRLGEEAFAAAWTEGRALTPAAVIADAQRDTAGTSGPVPSGPARPMPALPDGLTEREAQVLGLLAGGLSNKEIGHALVVSVRTVENHLGHIYAKIGARGRADAVAYAFAQGLAAPPSARG